MASKPAYTYGEVNAMYSTTVGNAQRDLNSLVSMALNQDEIINLVSDEGNVIMLSEMEYRSLRETIEILSHPDYLKTIVDGINTPLSECVPLSEVWPDV